MPPAEKKPKPADLFICPRCFYAKPEIALLSEKSTYTRHYRATHLDEKPWTCKVGDCHVKTTRRTLLKAHYSRCHPKASFNFPKRARGTTSTVPVPLRIEPEQEERARKICQQASAMLARGSRMTMADVKNELKVVQDSARDDPGPIFRPSTSLSIDSGYVIKVPELPHFPQLNTFGRQVDELYVEELSYPMSPDDDDVPLEEEHSGFHPEGSGWDEVPGAVDFETQPDIPHALWNQLGSSKSFPTHARTLSSYPRALQRSESYAFGWIAHERRDFYSGPRSCWYGAEDAAGTADVHAVARTMDEYNLFCEADGNEAMAWTVSI